MKAHEQKTVISCREGEVVIHCEHSKLVDPRGLIPHPDNNNLHSQEQVDLMKTVLKANGWRDAVVVSESNDRIISGHLRVLAAIDMGLEQVPVDLQVFANRVEEVRHLTADNEIARLAEFDKGIFLKTRKAIKKEVGKNQYEMDFKNPGAFGLLKWPKEDEGEKGKNSPLPIQNLLLDGDEWLLGGHTLTLGPIESKDQDHIQKFLRKWRKLSGEPAIFKKTRQTFDEVMDERRETDGQ